MSNTINSAPVVLSQENIDILYRMSGKLRMKVDDNPMFPNIKLKESSQQPTPPSQQPTPPSQQPTPPSQQPTPPSQQPTPPSQQPDKLIIGKFIIKSSMNFNPPSYIAASESNKIMKYITTCYNSLENLINYTQDTIDIHPPFQKGLIKETKYNADYMNGISIYNLSKIDTDMHAYCYIDYDPKWQIDTDASDKTVHVFENSKMKTNLTKVIDVKNLDYEFVRKNMIVVDVKELKITFDLVKELIYPIHFRKFQDDIPIIHILTSMFPALFFIYDNNEVQELEKKLGKYWDIVKNRYFSRSDYDAKKYETFFGKKFYLPITANVIDKSVPIDMYVLAKDEISAKMILSNSNIFTCGSICKWVYSPLFVPDKKKMVIVDVVIYATNRWKDSNREIYNLAETNKDINYFIYGLSTINLDAVSIIEDVKRYQNMKEIVLFTDINANNYDLGRNRQGIIFNYIISFFGIDRNQFVI
jgi:hypothetical protein